MPDDKPLEFALIAVPETTASTVYGLYDLFCSAGRDWGLLTGGEAGPTRIQPTIVSRDGTGFEAANGARIEPQRAFGEHYTPDAVCSLEILVPPERIGQADHAAEAAWLRRCYEAGSTIAAACTGALMLAEAGLLDGDEATTHWAFCDAMAEHYPRVRVHRDRALVVTGEGQRLLMAGGGTSWLDLGLYLVARYLGVEEAMRLAKVYLIDWHAVGQQPFALLTQNRQTKDARIADGQAWVAHHYDQPNPVRGMIRHSGLTERSFIRRFVRATGMKPMDYVHTLRIEEAKQLLEATPEAVEAIANTVGYEDASFFGRLFRRKVGLTPLQYRRRFGDMRRALTEAG